MTALGALVSPGVAAGQPVAMFAVGGDRQSTPVGTAFPAVLEAVVVDIQGFGVEGVAVTFAAPAAGPSGTFAGGHPSAVAVTDLRGLAASPAFTANDVRGSYVVVGSVPGLPSTASFNLTNTRPPAITDFTPASGPVGTSVTINGLDLTPLVSVDFNGTAAGEITSLTPTRIVATVPLGATTGPIGVTTTEGTTKSAAKFSVLPKIVGFTPASAAAGASVTITGSNLLDVTSVTFDGPPGTAPAPAEIVSQTFTEIRVVVPDNAATGTLSVAGAAGSTTSTAAFKVLPKIDSFAPLSGPRGSTVTITGTALRLSASGSPTPTVRFGTVLAPVVSATPSTVVATVPPTASGSVKIMVSTGDGTATSVDSFTVLAATAPVITSFTPASGTIGSTVTINGTNLADPIEVTFSGVPAMAGSSTDTQITATVPAGATTGKIAVTTAAGTGSSATHFTILPKIDSFTPASGAAGASVTITGSGFTGTTSVKFNAVSATFTVLLDTSIRATVPVTATTGKISVTTPGGTATSATDFVLPPKVTTFTPASGAAGATVTIDGTNLAGVTEVTFDGPAGTTPAITSPLSATATQVRVVVPNDAATGTITVTSAAGSDSSSAVFKVLPKIDSFAPLSGPRGSTVTITGTALRLSDAASPNPTVTFGSVIATVVSAMPSTVVATVPPAASGTVKISVTTGDGTTTSVDSFTVTAISPVITSFTPASGAVGTSVTIMGSGFTGTTSVKFSTVSSTFTFLADTSLRAVVPAGATTGKISVTTPGGVAFSAADFVLPPKITTFAPASGAAGTTVSINGTNLSGVTEVVFNGPAGTTPVVAAPSSTTLTQVRVVVPDSAATGTITVTAPTGGDTSAAAFKVLPKIDSFTPTSGIRGTTVTINGTALRLSEAGSPNPMVTFGVATATVVSATPSTVVATVPPTAVTGKISIGTGDGIATSTDAFTVIATQAVLAITNGNGGTVSIVDADKSAVTTTVAVGRTAGALAFFDALADGFTPPARLYVVASDEVRVLDAPGFAAGTVVPLGRGASALAIKPDGTEVWFANAKDDSLSIMDRSMNFIVGEVRFGKKSPGRGPIAVGFSADGALAFSLGGDSGSLVVIDAAKRSVAGSVGVGRRPAALAVHPRAPMVYVADPGGDAIVSVDVSAPGSPLVVGRVAVGTGPAALAVQGERLYVVNARSNTVTVLDLAADPAAPKPVATIAVGANPAGVAVLPPGIVGAGAFVSVVNEGDGTVSVIDASLAGVVATIPVGAHASGIAAGLLILP